MNSTTDERSDRGEGPKDIDRVNLLPLNAAAAEFLPAGWSSSDSSHLLALALWGMTEANLHIEVGGGRWVQDDDVEAAILRLMDSDPQEALDWAQGYDADGNEVLFWDDALDAAESAEDAAWKVIDAIVRKRNFLPLCEAVSKDVISRSRCSGPDP